MEKELYTKFVLFWSVLAKLWSYEVFEFSVSDVIPANTQNISSLVFFEHAIAGWESYKVLNLLWVEWRQSFVRRECTKHFITGFHYIFLLILWKNDFTVFIVVLTIYHELIKLRSFEWLNCFSTLVTSYTRINIHNMLIVAYM